MTVSPVGSSGLPTDRGCPAPRRRRGHNGAVRVLTTLLAAALVIGGCGWDDPNDGVRVVGLESPGHGDGAGASGRPGDGVAVGADAPSGDDGAGDADGDSEVASGSDQSEGDASGEPVDEAPLAGAIETIAVVGDSLTVSATEEIVDELTRLGFDVVAVDARESRRMAVGSSDLPSGVDAIETVLGGVEPDLWVIALGTNDVGALAGTDTFTRHLRSALDAVPSDAPVVWVDVWIRDRAAAARDANELIREELDRRPTVTAVVDWYANGTVDGVITRDGVHLTAAGRRLFASSIAEQVAALTGR